MATPAAACVRDCLLALCRSTSSPAEVRAAVEAVRAQGRARALAALAGHHGLLGLVLARLNREGCLDALDESEGEAFGLFRNMRIQAAIQDLERDRLLQQLADAGVAVVALKGAALRLSTYREPVERAIGDLDLLVLPDQLDAAVREVTAAGYEMPSRQLVRAYHQHHFHLPVSHPRGFIVELHWALSRPGPWFQLDSDGFWQRALLHRRPSGPPVRVPAAEDMVLHLASQNLEDSFSRLRRFVDLDRVIVACPQFDWDRLARSAKAGGLGHVLAHSLSLAHRLLGTPIAESVVPSLTLPRVIRAHVALLRPERTLLRDPGVGRAAAARLLELWLIAGFRARLAWMVEIMRGNDDPMNWVWHRLPDPERGRWRWLTGPAAALKMVVYQLWLYLTAPVVGALNLMSSPRRSARRSATPAP